MIILFLLLSIFKEIYYSIFFVFLNLGIYIYFSFSCLTCILILKFNNVEVKAYRGKILIDIIYITIIDYNIINLNLPLIYLLVISKY